MFNIFVTMAGLSQHSTIFLELLAYPLSTKMREMCLNSYSIGVGNPENYSSYLRSLS